jgi:acyl carrier protein
MNLLEELKQQLAELSEGKLAAASIDAKGHLFDYGYVDSLSAVMFLAHIEEKYGVHIEDMDLVEKYTTLEAVAQHVAESR